MGNDTIYLNWFMPQELISQPIIGWKVYRSTNSGAELSFQPIAVVEWTDYKDSNLTMGVTYYYVVTWYNQTCESPPSNEDSAHQPMNWYPVADYMMAIISDGDVWHHGRLFFR
jgi:hypothetical protein